MVWCRPAPGHGRPLCLPADDRAVHRRRLGRVGAARTAAGAATGRRAGGHHRAGGLRHGHAPAVVVLAERRHALFHALAVTPDNPVSEVLLGVYLNKVNQPELAARHFRAALALDPNDKTAHIDMGLYYEKIGKPEAAMVECREAIRCDAKFYPAIYYLGLLLEQLGRRDEAIAQYKATLAVQPDYADAKQRLRALGAPVP